MGYLENFLDQQLIFCLNYIFENIVCFIIAFEQLDPTLSEYVNEDAKQNKQMQTRNSVQKTKLTYCAISNKTFKNL